MLCRLNSQSVTMLGVTSRWHSTQSEAARGVSFPPPQAASARTTTSRLTGFQCNGLAPFWSPGNHDCRPSVILRNCGSCPRPAFRLTLHNMPCAILQLDLEAAAAGRPLLRPEFLVGTRFEKQNGYGKVGQPKFLKKATNDQTPGGSALGVWRSLTGCRNWRMAIPLTGIFRQSQPQGLPASRTCEAPWSRAGPGAWCRKR